MSARVKSIQQREAGGTGACLALAATSGDQITLRANVGPRRSGHLTPSEQRVAELAASGMKNRDVASTLFISPKTVEANLARIYRKLATFPGRAGPAHR